MKTRRLVDVVGSVIVIHAKTGKLTLKITGKHPMFQVVDSGGNEFAIEVADYEYASAGEVAAFYVERLRAGENRIHWN